MKKHIMGIILAASYAISAMPALAQDIRTPPPLLDGTDVTFFYQNGSGAHLEFYDGQMKYEWVAGPNEGNGNQDLPYRSRKIGENTYLISWFEESHPDFLTLIFNFDNNVMYSSGLVRFGTDAQRIVFDGGIIQNVNLMIKADNKE